jgi:hypothetical protein
VVETLKSKNDGSLPNFVDVEFRLQGERFIGEIKIFAFLTLDQVFRIALGQLLEYAHLRFQTAPHQTRRL